MITDHDGQIMSLWLTVGTLLALSLVCTILKLIFR